jgi:uncharacterized protein (TIGR02145 family)
MLKIGYFLKSIHPLLIAVICTQLCAQTTSTTIPIEINPGWNLLSLPFAITDGRANVVFPTAKSEAFIYHSNYQAADTLYTGSGFWLKFDSAETIMISGDPIYKSNFSLDTGWNMIGSLTKPIPVNSIQTHPHGIIISDWFAFADGRYQAADTLKSGLGYWVKVSRSGSMALVNMGFPCTDVPVVDYSGKTYNTVQIGNQCWLKENLDVGTMILRSENPSNNEVIEKYCYNDDTTNCNTYGGFYQWDEAMIYSITPGTKGICPSDWHIPTNVEFYTLGTTIDSNANALKAIGQGSGSGVGTNTSGFSGLLAGLHSPYGTFGGLGVNNYFWSSTQSTQYGYYIGYSSANKGITFGVYAKSYSFSVRCLKD